MLAIESQILLDLHCLLYMCVIYIHVGKTGSTAMGKKQINYELAPIVPLADDNNEKVVLLPAGEKPLFEDDIGMSIVNCCFHNV